MTVDSLTLLRDRLLPMMEVTADRYRGRVPRGYPHLIDTPEQGVLGLEIDSNHALFVTSDGVDLFAEVYRRSSRTDNRSGAGREKFSGLPFNDRRPITTGATDQELRDLLADLMSYFNAQPNLIHITDD